MVDEVKETQNDGEKPQEETGEENNYILPDEAYKVLKWLALIALPALASILRFDWLYRHHQSLFVGPFGRNSGFDTCCKTFP